MSYKKCFNPCDECGYSYSKNGQRISECDICEFNRYKKLEEQGRLIELPCAVGDEVFIIWGPRYRAGRSVYGINTGKFRLSDIQNLNNTVFTTREAAEAKLAEMEGAE